MSEFGTSFDKAQRAYDNRLPLPEDDEERYIQCRICGCEFEVMRQDQRICDDCQHKQVTEDDECQ